MYNYHIETDVLHQIPADPLTGAISVPIYQTSTYVQEAPGVHKGFDYSRTNNPTRKVLESLLAHLEQGNAGFAFASGLAAIDAVLKLFKTGDEIIACDDIYGGTFRLFTHVYQKLGIRIRYVDATNIQAVQDAVTKHTACIWIESPSNPTLKIADIQAIAQVAKQRNALLVVDNTFATPILQQPIALGADLVIHSATKYLGGHSDLIAGAVITANAELSQRIQFIQNASGGILAPFDSWLLIRGIETLTARIPIHEKNAQAVATFLQSHPLVDKVFYPGLQTHTNHAIACKQQKGFGSIISFSLKNNTIEAVNTFLKQTRLFKLAESLGGVKSLVCHPAQMTHKSIPEEIRLQSGIATSLIRLSLGLEHEQDLIHDLQTALQIVSPEAIHVK